MTDRSNAGDGHWPQQTANSRKRRGSPRRRRLLFEQLESRRVLDGLSLTDYDTVSPEWLARVLGVWVRSDDYVVAAAGEAATALQAADAGAVAVGRWIVRLTPEATAEAGAVQRVESCLDDLAVDFRVLRGLGLPGQVLVETASTAADVRAALSANVNVAHFSPDRLVSAQVMPDDGQFSSQTNLHNDGQSGGRQDADIDAPEAWAISTGSTGVVVGVLDSGVDMTHPDLYLNIWINPGEIPPNLRGQLADADGDGRITFYDLNDPANARWVTDANVNGYIDAQDLLSDSRWADGIDTDGNRYEDDLCGWNFRKARDDPFAPNDPRDAEGHGTHVAGTIAAIGNNGLGVAGINWRSSVMVLRFLDDANRGLTSDAIEAINYATRMRKEYGVNVRVLNNSWGQNGGFDANLRDAIAASGVAGILSVAAAGNGNVLGQGMDNDRIAFYPAGYALDNVIAVAATDDRDELGRASNYGAQSVDLAAPGVGVWSTMPGGKYASLSGTSMAAPHVSGAAALLLAMVPEATLAELRQAILGGVDQPINDAGAPLLAGRLATAGRLNLWKVLQSEGFAPQVELVAAPDVVAAGPTGNDLVVRYSNPAGIDVASVDAADLTVSHQWGAKEDLAVALQSTAVLAGGREVVATYRVTTPDGTWGPLDYGRYAILLRPNQIRNTGQPAVVAPARELGSFRVKISDDAVFYVSATDDVVGGDCHTGNCPLRAAIRAANAAGGPHTIILDPGIFQLSVAGSSEDAAATGDLDITGDITIVGAGQGPPVMDVAVPADAGGVTTIVGDGRDRVFHVLPGGRLNVAHLQIMGGTAGEGGGVLSAGDLVLREAVVGRNTAQDRGGGVALAGGRAHITDTTFSGNNASRDGSALAVLNDAGAFDGSPLLERSAIIHNGDATLGPGSSVLLQSSKHIAIRNTTISGNFGGVRAGGDVLLESVTLVDNSAGPWPGLMAESGTVAVHNTIAWRNGSAGDVRGAVTSQGYNLVGDVPDGLVTATDHQSGSAEAVLSPLGAYGGGTVTHTLTATSPAVDAGDPSVYPATDQRGTARPQDGDGRRGAVPDIGAFERYQASIRGTLFRDLNQNGVRDPGEPGVSGEPMFLDVNGNGLHEAGEPETLSTADDPQTSAVSESGQYQFSGLVPGTYYVAPDVADTWAQTTAGIQRIAVLGEYNFPGNLPQLSRDGRYVAFVSEASDLVAGDSNESEDVFVYDRQQRSFERFADVDGTELSYGAEPSISYDGRFVGYRGLSDSLARETAFVFDRQQERAEEIPESEDYSWEISPDGRFFVSVQPTYDPFMSGTLDLVIYDRETDTLERSAIEAFGEGAYPPENDQWISADGRFVALTGMMEPDMQSDVFVYDREEHQTERLDLLAYGYQDIGPRVHPALSADGRFVAFESFAYGLLVCDRQNETGESLRSGENPSVSGDGRFVAFDAYDAYVPEDTNQEYDVYVYDREQQRYGLVSIGARGPADGGSEYATISADGRWIAFESEATNLLEVDTDGSSLYITRNPLMDPWDGQVVGLSGGQELAGIDFGIVPLPGEVRGHVFHDLIRNSGYDAGEPGLTQWEVFLDANGNRTWDQGESRTMTDGEGAYTFPDLASDATYSVVCVMQEGWNAVLSSTAGIVVRELFLPAYETIADVDFGMRPSAASGATGDGELRGRLFLDGDGDLARDPDETGLPDKTVFLDINDDGIRQENEPRQETLPDDSATPDDETGMYSFTGLGNRSYTVRVDPESISEREQQAAPIENQFARFDYSLGAGLASPQDVALGDFDGDGDLDMAVAVYHPVSVKLLLNDGQGRFGSGPLTIALPRGDAGAMALVSGDFNRRGAGDLAVVNELSGSVSVLLDFDGQQFTQATSVKVGTAPLALCAGDVDGDQDVDLAVANSADGNLSILRNNGAGTFTPDAARVPVGKEPYAVVVGRFDGDSTLDLATADFGSGADFGGVSILLNDGHGAFPNRKAATLDQDLARRPADLAVGDFDGNGKTDLAVANFESNNVAVLLGVGDGTFVVDAYLPAGGVGPMDVEVADLDRDTDWDVLVASVGAQGGDQVAVLRNTLQQRGFGFEPPASHAATNFPEPTQLSLQTGDLDGDQTVDVAIANGRQGKATVWRNTLAPGAYHVASAGSYLVTGLDFPIRTINTPPTLDALPNVPIDEDAPLQSLTLTGIAPGEGGMGPLRITAHSDAPELIVDLAVAYTSPDTTGTLTFRPAHDQTGTAVITVQVENAGLDGNLETPADNGSRSRSFTVTAHAVNDPPTLASIPNPAAACAGCGVQTVALAGITGGAGESQRVRVTASSDSAAITQISVVYVANTDTATLRYTPASGQTGEYEITVTVTDAGPDNSLETAADNEFVFRTFTVTVTGAHPWQNPSNRLDIDDDGKVIPLDVLKIINYLNNFGPGLLPLPPPNPGGPPPFVDSSGDDAVGPLDVLQVINHLNSLASA